MQCSEFANPVKAVLNMRKERNLTLRVQQFISNVNKHFGKRSTVEVSPTSTNWATFYKLWLLLEFGLCATWARSKCRFHSRAVSYQVRLLYMTLRYPMPKCKQKESSTKIRSRVFCCNDFRVKLKHAAMQTEGMPCAINSNRKQYVKSST